MPSRKPGSVTAAAIMAIIFGSLALLCGFCGIAGQAAQGANFNFMGGQGDPNAAVFQELQKEMEKSLQAEVPFANIIQIAGTIINLVLGSLMLIGGTGLINMKPWSRKLTLSASLLFILNYLIQIVFQLVKVMPATKKAMQEAMPKAMEAMPKGGAPLPPNFPEMMETFVYLGFGLMMVFFVFVIIYLLIIVGLLMRKNVRIAFANLGQPGLEEAGGQQFGERREHDDDWQPRTSPPPAKDQGPDWGIKPKE